MPKRRANREPQLVMVGARYAVQWYDELGRQRRTSLRTSDRAEALRRMARWMEGGDPAAIKSPTLEQMATAWMMRVAPRSFATITHQRTSVSRLLAFAGDWRLDLLAPLGPQVEDLSHRIAMAWREKGYSQTTAAVDLQVLRSILRHAHRRGELLDEPAHRDVVAPPAKRREEILSLEQIAKLFESLPRLGKDGRVHPVRRFYMLLYWTGGRPGAVSRLEWRHVDMDARTIDLRPYYSGPTKRGALVPISPILWPHIEQWYKERINIYVLDTPNLFYRHKTAEYVKKIDPNASLHTIRHSRITHLLMAGATAEQAAAIVGNSPRIVNAVYSKLAHGGELVADAITRADYRLFGDPNELDPKRSSTNQHQ